VLAVTPLTPHLHRVIFAGDDLSLMEVPAPAASVRLLLPPAGTADLVLPVWSGNEFLLPGGERPPIRTFTPRRVTPDAGEIDLEIVLHSSGVASDWARAASEGAPVALSGPGRGYAIDAEASGFLLAGDESALPAISQLLEVLPPALPVQVHLEVAHPDARLPLPDHPGATVAWRDLPAGSDPGATFVAAVQESDLPEGVRAWVAGEAAAVQRVRKHLFAERGLARSQATVRGYWKRGKAAGAGVGGT